MKFTQLNRNRLEQDGDFEEDSIPYDSGLVNAIERGAMKGIGVGERKERKGPWANMTSELWNFNVTILFNKDDVNEEPLLLPFQSSPSLVYNLTNYRTSWLQGIRRRVVLGELVREGPERLSDVFVELESLRLRDLFLIQRNAYSFAKGVETTTRFPSQENYGDRALSWIMRSFTNESCRREPFIIDRDSDVFVDVRKRGGARVYNLGINIGIYPENPKLGKAYQIGRRITAVERGPFD